VDLKGLRVAVIAGSNYADLAERIGAEPVVVGSLDGAVKSVEDGTVAAAMDTAPTLKFLEEGPTPTSEFRRTTYRATFCRQDSACGRARRRFYRRSMLPLAG